MAQIVPLLELNQAVDQAVERVTWQLREKGLQVLRTFDLQNAREAHGDCPCPHHGTDQCDCQMVVLLVYDGDRNPVTLVVHGSGGRAWFSLIDSPEQYTATDLERAVRQTLAAQNLLG